MSPAEGPLVEVEIRGAVALVRLNRPRVLNALDLALTVELSNLIDRLATEADLKVAVTCGAGQAYCVGNDLKETATIAPAEAEALATAQEGLMDRWAALPLITMAIVHGFALGGGLLLAAFHDLRVAAEGTQFGLPEITLGLPPAFGIHRLIRLLGEARAREIILTGVQFDAGEARRMGLVNRVVATDVLLDEGLAWATELSRLPEGAIKATKRLLGHIVGPHQGGEPQAFGACLGDEEARTRIRSFLKARERP